MEELEGIVINEEEYVGITYCSKTQCRFNKQILNPDWNMYDSTSLQFVGSCQKHTMGKRKCLFPNSDDCMLFRIFRMEEE